MIDINADFFDSNEPTQANTSHFVKVGREQSKYTLMSTYIFERTKCF